MHIAPPPSSLAAPRVSTVQFGSTVAMPNEHARIGSCNVSVVLGDMTKIKCDAYVVPQFDSCTSFGGVGGAVARAGARRGMDEYQEFVDSQGVQPFGRVLLTNSGGGNSRQLLHVVSVGSDREHEFNTVQTTMYNALKVAQENGIRSIVAPALGTGIIGQLTGEQSARAILSAINQFAKEGGNVDVTLAIYDDRDAYQDFARTLRTKSYETADREQGRRELDPVRWVIGMRRDADANRKDS